MLVALLRGSQQAAALLARQGKTWRFNSGTVPGCGHHHLNRLRTRAVMVSTHPGARASQRKVGLAELAVFWPPKDAQRCHLLRISEQHLGRSAAEWTGSGYARHSLRIRRLWPGTCQIT
jgi:hypothetical protein